MGSLKSYFAAFVVAAVVAGLLTPLVRMLAFRTGAVAGPSARTVHQRQIPRLGGVAICLALLVPVVGLLFVESGVAVAFKANPRVVLGLSVGGIAMCIVGAVDDLRGLRAVHKLLMQVMVGVLAYACGFRIDAIQLPLLGDLQMGIFALPITVMWVVGVINAVNLIDGLDGLAAGVAFFAGLTNFVIAYISGGTISALIMASLLGATIGFLFYNFNPARIFMGDSGSYLLGYVLAVAPLVGPSQKSSAAVSLLVPVVALGVPIFDTLFTIVRRILERRPLFSPDRGHVHHRLLDLGITHRRAVLILYGVCVVFTAAAIGIHLGRSWQIGLALLVASMVMIGLARFVGYFSIWHLRTRQRSRLRSRDTELLRRALPDILARMRRVKSEDEMVALLETVADEVCLASLVLSHGDEAVMHFADGSSDGRRVVATMSYPVGIDALAQATLTAGVVSDFEDAEMSPETGILLQVIADVLAEELNRVGSPLAPRTGLAPNEITASSSGESVRELA
jgi:UDP-GlcNAc:undecaprenyl-phosphate/decaprenyl-phosphate GlcNAc-1-phosphate transferase